MIANELHEDIYVLKRDITRNEYGEPEVIYTDYKKLKAGIFYRTSREKEIDNQLTAVRIIKFKIRFRRDLDETMVIRFWGDLYDIRSIEHFKRQDTYIIAERGKLTE